MRCLTAREERIIAPRRMATNTTISGTETSSTSASTGSMENRTMNAPTSVTKEMNRSSGPWCANSVMSNRSVVTRDISRPVRFLS